MYTILDIADYIIQSSNEKHIGMSNLKLQAVLYFLQAEFLVRKNEVCFKEKIEAWSFGPVVRSIYEKYIGFGGGSIILVKKKDFEIKKEDKKIIDNILEDLDEYSASALSKIIRNQDPWIKAYKKEEKSEITLEELRNFFKED